MEASGLPTAPEPYLDSSIGEKNEPYCANHNNPLLRSEDGTKNSPVIVYRNRENGDFFNESITYNNSDTLDVEQSIAAAYLTYLYRYQEIKSSALSDAEKNSEIMKERAKVQNVVWSSGQWEDKDGYVENLVEYTDTKQSSGTIEPIYDRAEGWAAFYYNLLYPNDMKMNIEVMPTNENDIKIYVDQNARTYTEGPYIINLLDKNQNVINDTEATNHSSGTLGNLVYQEICGLNIGCSKFQFVKLQSATATLTYTDGSSEENSNITILDANGDELFFPKFGEIFYIRIEVPSDQTKTISKIEPHFNLQYLTKIPGSVVQYKNASLLKYEINDKKVEEWAEAWQIRTDGHNSTWCFEKTIAEMSSYTTEGEVIGYLYATIYSKAKAAGFDLSGSGDHRAYTSAYLTLRLPDSSVKQYTNPSDFKTDVYNYYWDRESGSITQTTIWKYNNHEYTTQQGAINDCLNDGNDPSTDITEIDRYTYDGTNYDNNKSGAEQAAADKTAELTNKFYENAINNNHWYFNFNGHNPIFYENVETKNIIQQIIIINLTGQNPTGTPDIWTWGEQDSVSFDLIARDCTVELGGKVWVDVGATKESSLNGRLNSGGADTGDYRYAGMEVQLYLVRDRSNSVGYAITDSNGAYHFYNLNALEDYIVVFKFNGQLYQQTYYKEDLSGGFSNAKEVGRSELNDRFDRIDSYPSNYNLNGWHIAYGKNVKLKRDDGTYIQNGTDSDGNAKALTYLDAWDQFVSLAVSTGSYDNAYNSLRSWLQNQGVGSTDTDGVIQFIRDCMITAETRNYPVYDQFIIEDLDNPPSNLATETAVGQTWNYLYTQPSDQSRNVDFGINERDTADMALQKDVYKATVRVNGKTQTYMYSNKDLNENGDWEITIKNADGSYSGRYANGLYNGDTRYTREIRKSEYLYDGTIYNVGGTDARDLRVYVTYRIALRNQSQTFDTIVNEITDYFDTSEYVFDGTWDDATQSYKPNEYSDFEVSNAINTDEKVNVTSYIGDRNGNYLADLVVKRESVLNNGEGDNNLGYGYNNRTQNPQTDESPLYISGEAQTIQNETLTPISMPITNEQGQVTGASPEITKGGGLAFVYLTFEVKKAQDENGMDGRVQMDVNVSTGADKGVGKQNLAEINSYSTYYGSDEKIPNTLNPDNTVNDTLFDGQKGGVIDVDSTVGNLSSQDLEPEGEQDSNGQYNAAHLIVEDDPITNRAEDDTDQAPNIRLVFPASDDYERVAQGYVYEDVRNQESNQAMVGNGRYSDTDQDSDGNKDTKINGVTVQLVELVQDINPDGTPNRDANGNYAYLGEYIWTARTWDSNTKQWVNANSSANSGSLRYYSGQGNYATDHTVAPIISGAGATAISGYTFGDDSTGEYAFKGMPAGDFIVRFIYGDTTQTVLTTEGGEGDEVVQLLKGDTADSNVNDTSGYISKSGLNAKSYNGQDYKSTTYQPNISQEGSYNGVYGYGYDANGANADKYNTQNYEYHKDSQPTMGTAGEAISNYVNIDDGTNKDINYYYNIGESQVQSGASDAKDVGNIRKAANDYGRGMTGIEVDNPDDDTQTIVNGRSEVLTAGLKVASTEDLVDGATTSVAKQIAMIKELMSNTEMVAQSGVINAEVEWNTNITTGQSYNNNGEDKPNRLNYVLDDIDLGLEERPIAQLVMNKEVANVRITLQNGTILFDTNRSVTNMPFAEHAGHKITYSPEDPNGSAYRLKAVEVSNNSTNTPELITTYMDEELMYGARIEVDYAFTVTNVGEVDYLDNQFYYTGVTNDTSASNISTTTANTVVDYVTNNMQFLPTNSNNSGWSIRTVEDLTSDPSTESTDYEANPVGNNTDLINNKYYNTLNTYNTIVTSKDLALNLYPEEAQVVADEEVADPQSSSHTTMMLSTTLTPDSGEDTMVYNNLCEIIQVSNSQGRRLKWSVTGNQPMANQDSGSDVPADPDEEQYTKVDLVTPKEIDADSSQEILILPPTGANRNYTLWIIVGVIALVIIAGGVILIRRYFKKK